MKVLFLLLTLFFSSFLLAAEDNVDPWEGFNRKVFSFNETVDQYFLKPVAKGYNTITPTVVNNGISNMFSNLGEILTTGNALLQAKPASMGKSILRFTVNSTVGIFGFFDVATSLGIDEQKEDFGQTLAVWGVPTGPYLVLPFWGSADVRDAGALSVDVLASPLYVDHVPTRNTVYAVKAVDSRADVIKAEDLITGDRYSFIRTAYLQNRNYLVNDGKVEDSFGEEQDAEQDNEQEQDSIDSDSGESTENTDDWMEE